MVSGFQTKVMSKMRRGAAAYLRNLMFFLKSIAAVNPIGLSSAVLFSMLAIIKSELEDDSIWS